MALKAITRAKHYIRPAKPFLGNATPYFECTASAAVVKGDVLKIASGKVARASDPSSARATGIFGIAAHGVSSASDTVQVIPAVPGLIFEAAVNGSASTAAKYTSKTTDVGLRYALDLSSTNKCWFVNKDISGDTADKTNVTVVGLKDAASTSQGHVYIVFHASGTKYAGPVTASSHAHG